MTTRRDSDLLIAAFFETMQPDLPDRTFDAVRRDIHRTRQHVVLGPIREPELHIDRRFVAMAAAVIVVGIALFQVRPVAGPGIPSPMATSTPTPTVPPSASVVPSAAIPVPTAFTSPLYGYTATIPAGWAVAPAVLRWDGKNQPGPDADTDKFGGPDQITLFAFAGSFTGDLDAFVTDRIAATHRDHSDTCPIAKPDVNQPFQIGGQAWVLLAWDCGGLINQAVTVHKGVAYSFVFRDLAIKAATDPADDRLFQSILQSVRLPD